MTPDDPVALRSARGAAGDALEAEPKLIRRPPPGVDGFDRLLLPLLLKGRAGTATFNPLLNMLLGAALACPLTAPLPADRRTAAACASDEDGPAEAATGRDLGGGSGCAASAAAAACSMCSGIVCPPPYTFTFPFVAADPFRCCDMGERDLREEEREKEREVGDGQLESGYDKLLL